jgi:hypothetical protein
MTQKQFQTLILPVIKEKGKVYKKYTKVYASVAKGGEKIYTITDDGPETVNIAKKGDFIIKNQTETQENYIVEKEAFEKRYKLIKKLENGYAEYQSIGKVIALAYDSTLMDQLDLGEKFYFIAIWGERMVVKENDFLVCPPDYSEVYRIARKEFFETYILDT